MSTCNVMIAEREWAVRDDNGGTGKRTCVDNARFDISQSQVADTSTTKIGPCGAKGAETS